MNQRQLSREPEVYTFREQKILDYLVFLNEHYPTASRYPVRLLRIKEQSVVQTAIPLSGFLTGVVLTVSAASELFPCTVTTPFSALTDLM